MNFTLDEKAFGDNVAPLLICFLEDSMTAKMNADCSYSAA